MPGEPRNFECPGPDGNTGRGRTSGQRNREMKHHHLAVQTPDSGTR